MSEVTRILSNIEQGDPEASAALLPLVYDQLRKLASRELRGATGNTLQPTALVHEAYVRLVDQKNEPQWNHRGHFYAAAAESMRRIVVESVRRKQTIKRGGDRERVPLDDARHLAEPKRDADLLALDDALTRLAETKPEIAKLVSLRYFAGLTMGQAANAMGIPLRTAERNWTYAKAWLSDAMQSDT